MTCRSIYRIVFQEDHQHSPVVHLELTAKQKIKQQIQRSIGNSLLVDMGWGEVESSLEDIVFTFLKLKEIAIKFVWSSRRIKHFCRFLVYRQVPVVLFVPHENYPKYHRQLGGADFITLHPFLLDYSPYASSSEEEYERLDVNAENQPSSNKRKPTISNEGCSPPSDLSKEDVPAEAARKQAEENAQGAQMMHSTPSSIIIHYTQYSNILALLHKRQLHGIYSGTITSA